MRPLLTRRVIRLIIDNELSSSTRRWISPAAQCLRRRLPVNLPPIYARSLFGFSRKSKRTSKPVNYEPGFETMLELKERLSRGERTPPPEELVQAFVDFFQFKQKNALLVEDIQAERALTTLEHLQKTHNEAEGYWLTIEDLRMVLGALRLSKNSPYKSHNKLARLLFEDLQRRRDISVDGRKKAVPFERDLMLFIRVMCHSGDALYSRDLVEKYWRSDLKHAQLSPWAAVLKGLSWENKGEELQKTIEIMKTYDVPFVNQIHQAITTYYASILEDMNMTKQWYGHPIASGQNPTLFTNKAVLRLCIKSNEFEWGDSIFKTMLEGQPEHISSWNVIFQWAAAKGKSVDEIERMMQVMVRKGEERDVFLHPEMDSINGLIELANSRDDPYTAERYVALAYKWGLQPNARTYLLQMEYRIKVGDLVGARTAYARLQGEEVPANEDLGLVNKLIVALCVDKRQNYEAIMGLVEDLSERKARLEPDTVAALSELHLERGEMDDLVDLLNTHAFQYGTEQRAAICEILLRHCLKPSTTTQAAWETYNVLRRTFTETGLATRLLLMKNFFHRKRSDMATHVFSHMRQQQTQALRPTAHTYAQCLSGIAGARDLESLRTVYNMIKLDNTIEPNTQLYSALMLAYSACGESRRALTFWEDIVHSREGPSYASIQIALRACEGLAVGERVAQGIWEKLKKFEIEVTREIYAAYVGVFAAHNLYDKCINLIEESEKEVGYKPDALLLGTFHNATPGSEGKQKVKEWASKTYPAAYEDLLRVGQYTVSQLDEEGIEQSYLPSETLFDIDSLGRSVEP